MDMVAPKKKSEKAIMAKVKVEKDVILQGEVEDDSTARAEMEIDDLEFGTCNAGDEVKMKMMKCKIKTPPQASACTLALEKVELKPPKGQWKTPIKGKRGKI